MEDQDGNSTPEPNISADNYGDNVNYSISFNGNVLDEWKLFYKNNDVVYIICNELVPVPEEYPTWSNDVFEYLNNTSNWEGLLTNNLKSKGVEAIGTVDLKTWVSSWNSKGYPNINILEDDKGWIGFSDKYDLRMGLNYSCWV